MANNVWSCQRCIDMDEYVAAMHEKYSKHLWLKKQKQQYETTCYTMNLQIH